MGTGEDVLAWLREVATARSTQVVDVPGGAVLLNQQFPAAHDHNKVLLWDGVDAVDAVLAMASADALIGGSGMAHRRIEVQSIPLALRLAPELEAAGYARTDEVVMSYVGSDPLPQAVEIVELELARRAAVAEAEWREDQPEWGAEVARQLGDRVVTLLGVVEPTFLAATAGGQVVAHADLFVRGNVAQIEEVMTRPAAQGRGLATALVLDAVARARRAGAVHVVLIADADDWPAGWYRRLGFVDLTTTAVFSR